MKDYSNLKIDMSRGLVSALEIACLPGREVKSFCHSVRKITQEAHICVDPFCEIFPVSLFCICGLKYTFDSVEEVPSASYRCPCGSYLVKYLNHAIH